ncbi:serine dehydratase beta chain [Arthrobacter sp. H41]|uniref:serine dehydratase beta chain n=1 Tax=Arthrobacter sp. H41 TaxID=1312978 RepID=UPI0009DCF4C4
MALGVLDLFSVGIGSSSSHTVAPMRAAKLFADGPEGGGLLSSTTRVRAELFGSLGATGRGHGSDKAVVPGFEGLNPETVDTTGERRWASAVRLLHQDTKELQHGCRSFRPLFHRDRTFELAHRRTDAGSRGVQRRAEGLRHPC